MLSASNPPRIMTNPQRITSALVCEDQLSQRSVPLVLHDLGYLGPWTGASKEGPTVQEKWWQPERTFAQGLIDQPRGESHTILDIKWSGDNSELERREAGRQLAAKVIDLEQ